MLLQHSNVSISPIGSDRSELTVMVTPEQLARWLTLCRFIVVAQLLVVDKFVIDTWPSWAEWCSSWTGCVGWGVGAVDHFARVYSIVTRAGLFNYHFQFQSEKIKKLWNDKYFVFIQIHIEPSFVSVHLPLGRGKLFLQKAIHFYHFVIIHYN